MNRLKLETPLFPPCGSPAFRLPPVRPAENFDVIVLGAGAAGLMCAIEAGKGGRRVAVIERADRIGKKILISGGGRCNFTNIHCRPENFISANPHFCKSALSCYTPRDFINLVEKHCIAYHEKTLGQLFCDGHASQIVNMLELECKAVEARIMVKTEVMDLARAGDAGFVLQTSGSEFRTKVLVVATGGLSIPKIGATSFGYDLARQFGLRIQECRPALVPLTFNAEDRKRYCDLSGVSMEVVASAGHERFRERTLVTHRGLSGPAILQTSSYWRPPEAIEIDLAPDRDVTAVVRSQTAQRAEAVRQALRAILPNRFADRWLDVNTPPDWTNSGLAQLERRIHNWQVFPQGTEGYDKAEVTAGGVDTNELSAKTMQTRKIPGLFFIGEVVDVTGHLGGFNFQWAWASGAAAGRYLAEKD
jgi:predicted Rossmann fold flavoprotein